MARKVRRQSARLSLGNTSRTSAQVEKPSITRGKGLLIGTASTCCILKEGDGDLDLAMNELVEGTGFDGSDEARNNMLNAPEHLKPKHLINKDR